MNNRKKNPKICVVEDCDRLEETSGYCSPHYKRLLRYGDPLAGKPYLPRVSPEERFWRYVDLNGPLPDKCPELGCCWVWIGAIRPDGRGQLYWPGYTSPQRAHRVSYLLAYGSMPPNDLELDHLCHRPLCVRPTHLEPVTHIVNLQRRDHLGGWAGENAAKTHCPQGHALTPDNLVPSQKNRHCLICTKQQKQEWEMRKRGINR